MKENMQLAKKHMKSAQHHQTTTHQAGCPKFKRMTKSRI